ncbi:secretin and TonB N-terminal domain-containing protein [Roseateles amylovorans]|uniref:Secretin and TonB N-terminal domain-containing protein n=1 Tax=Roseateles amylovorans TaxID=2978473 RepID=A0ABY6AX15_9BURK|nr:secretin and TonB N-terminal domain-containing protein [Roseateles amylovorans]UXH77422.1 secretin and TonB N-terminal domain-containing protein [Roseateles amylovorans]
MASEPRQQDPQYFDIPGQPLASALERYAVVTDQTVLFSDDLVALRRSSAVEGRYTAREALDLLLTGTSLRAERVGAGAKASFVLRPLLDDAAPTPAEALDRRYDGLVQHRIWKALCATAQTAPGGYRAVLRLEIDAAGRLSQPRLLTTTGSPRRDEAIVAALQGLQVEAAPPAGLQQPLTLVLLPRPAGQPSGCLTEGRSP